DLPLDYSAGAPGDGVTLEGAALRTQPVNGNSGIYQGAYAADGADIAGAIDFEAWGTTTLSRVVAEGFIIDGTGGNDLAEYAESVFVAIYPDAGGQPDTVPFWSDTSAFTDPQVSGANGNIDIQFAAGPTLAAGTWWLVVQPEFSTDFATGVAWLWYQAAETGRYPGMFRDYGNSFGIAGAGWVELYWLL